MTEREEEVRCYHGEHVKRCTGCNRFGRCSPRPHRTDFFARARDAKGRVHGYQARCRRCKSEAQKPKTETERRFVARKQREGYHRRMEDPAYRETLRTQGRERKRRAAIVGGEEELARRREASRKYAASVASDPAYRKRKNASRRARRARLKVEDPEAYRRLRERETENKRRRLQDPRAAARELEARRMADRLRRERAGAASRPARRVGSDTGGMVPAAPIVALLDEMAVRVGIEAVCVLADIAPRTVREWRDGYGRRARGDVADRVIVRAGALWHDVFDPQRFPGVFADRQRDDVLAWIDAVDQASWSFEGEHVIGD